MWLFSEVGPRPGEIADPADHLLRFVDIHGDHMEIEGKVGPRAVPISPGLRQALLGLRGGRPLDDPVFLDDRCTHYLTVSGLRRSVRRVMEGAGISRGVKLCPYTLRHSVGTQAVEDGTDLDVVQRVLGHRSINTTMKYRHISGAQVKAAWKRGKGEPDFCAKSAPAAHRG